MPDTLLYLLLALLGYAAGSIPSAVIVCRAMGLPDPLASGSHNPGATNVLRIGGRAAGVITLLGDGLKGALPVLVARALDADPWGIALAGMAAFLGHLYPLFLGMRGGKGAATAAGVWLAVSAPLAAMLLLVWLGAALVSRYSSVASLSAAALATPLVWWLQPQPGYLGMSVVMAGLMFWRHRGNLRRLAAGEEGKIRLSGTGGGGSG